MAPTTSVKRHPYPGEFVWRLDDAGSIRRPRRNPPLPQSEVQAQYRARLNDKSTQEEEEAEKDMSHSAIERFHPTYSAMLTL